MEPLDVPVLVPPAPVPPPAPAPPLGVAAPVVELPPDAAEPPVAGVIAPELPADDAPALPEAPLDADAGELVPDVVDVVDVDVVAEVEVVGGLTAELDDVGTVNAGTSEVSSAFELPPPQDARTTLSTIAAHTAANGRARW
ncbi:MAG: hypothetical protein JO039_16440 [Solirubrobacterales bacterium]|nr:hypothetical protein [Solirubrobacterales bacterium]